MRTLAFLLTAVIVPTSTILAQTWTPEQQEIWRLENQQWDMAAAKDTSWLATMVHPNLSYWEIDQVAPQNRASLSRWVRYNNANVTTLEHELFPISVTITGTVAVAQYRYRVAYENYKKERDIATGHFTDVFIREGTRWLFIAWAGGDDPKK